LDQFLYASPAFKLTVAHQPICARTEVLTPQESTMDATVVEVDLINYSEIAHQIERELGLGAAGVSLLNQQLEDLVKRALHPLRLEPKKIIKNNSGDGFVLVFDHPDDAHRFSVEFHKVCIEHNQRFANKSAHRWFRVGAATGDLNEVDNQIAGVSIIEAVRLESKGNKGHILIDKKTYSSLTNVCRNDYPSKSEPITDKHNNIHQAHRYVINGIPEERSPGVVSPTELWASNNRLSDEVFAVEILTQPVKLERDKYGAVTVTINRNGVKDMVISNAGKSAMTERYVTLKNKPVLLQLDREVQTFLVAGGSPDTMSIDLPELRTRLRWASGGVLSIVTDPHGKQWVPLFFRDIRPYGWNIALGTTERWFNKTSRLVDRNYNLELDLNSPRTFIFREFLEESIVVNGDPRANETLIHKRFRFINTESPVSDERATEFYEKHSNLREAEDRLKLKESESTTDVTFQKTNCSLRVLSDSGSLRTNDLLICFSLLDLGIEVVRVARYNFMEGDWMLDGEIREKHRAETGQTERELIRMPVAMLSLEYLREIFASREDWHCYTFGPQPSIQVQRAPTRDEIIYFSWDIERRMKAVEGEWGENWHRDRFVDWYDKFGSYFVEESKSAENRWQVSSASPAKLFVPGTAKILNLYFCLLDGKEQND
jgi:class 3 adenylate cyclase